MSQSSRLITLSWGFPLFELYKHLYHNSACPSFVHMLCSPTYPPCSQVRYFSTLPIDQVRYFSSSPSYSQVGYSSSINWYILKHWILLCLLLADKNTFLCLEIRDWSWWLIITWSLLNEINQEELLKRVRIIYNMCIKYYIDCYCISLILLIAKQL